MAAYRRDKSGSAPAAPRALAASSFLQTLWDMSLAPSNNQDVRERLGKGGKSRAVALVDVDEKTGRHVYADGITNSKRRKLSLGQMDPDGFVCRLFGTPTDRYVTWMPRLTADMDENQSGENCRSTMITDNANDMSFGWITDILSLVDAPSGGDLIGEGLAYDPAGFLEGLYEKEYNDATYKRSALSLSLHRNKGFISDGEKLAQLSHVFCFVTGGGGTVSAATGQSLRSRSGVELALRGDSAIKFSDGVGRWNMERPPDVKDPKEDEARLVHFFLHLPGKKDEKFDTGNDKNADYQKMEKVAGKQNIQGWVRVPKSGSGDSHRYDYSYHSPPPPPPPGSSSGSDTPTGGGPTAPSSGQNPSGGGTPAPSDVYDDENVRPEEPSTETGSPTEGAKHGFRRVAFGEISLEP